MKHISELIASQRLDDMKVVTVHISEFDLTMSFNCQVKQSGSLVCHTTCLFPILPQDVRNNMTGKVSRAPMCPVKFKLVIAITERKVISSYIFHICLIMILWRCYMGLILSSYSRNLLGKANFTLDYAKI